MSRPIPNRRCPFILVFALLFGTASLNAQDISVIHFSLENDSFSGNENDDDNYTWGGKLALVTTSPCVPVIDCYPFSAYDDDADRTLFRRITFIGSTAFTPRQLDTPAVLYKERPYASFTYAGFGQISYSPLHRAVWKLELQVGKIGGTFAGDAQSFLHRNKILTIRPIPEGWHNQIGHPGAFGINLFAEWTKNVLRIGVVNDSFTWLYGNTIVGGNIGNCYVNIFGGAEVRLINLNAGFFSMASADVPKITQNAAAVRNNRNQKDGEDGHHDGENNQEHAKCWKAYFFLRVTGRYIHHNTLLEDFLGNNTSVHAVSGNDMRRGIAEGEAGFYFGLGDRIGLQYSLVYRTKEFDGANEQHHVWGSGTMVFSL